MEDWRHHSPHLCLQHRRDGQDVNEGFGRHLNVGEGKLQFRSSLNVRTAGTGAIKNLVARHKKTLSKHCQTCPGRRLNRFRDLE